MRQACSEDARIKDLLYEASAWRFRLEEEAGSKDRAYAAFKRDLVRLVGAHREDGGPGFLSNEETHAVIVKELANRLGY